MSNKISQKIVGFRVVNKSNDNKKEKPLLVRDDRLSGDTYRVKSPLSPAALYVTVNNTEMNNNTGEKLLWPFEVFINTKNMQATQYLAAITRLISAIFRTGHDYRFIVEELKQIIDPQGGYHKGGKYVPSLVAEIGQVIEEHFIRYGMLEAVEPTKGQAELLATKQQSLKKKENTLEGSFCEKCNQKTLIYEAGCYFCTNCLDSRCD